MVNPFKRKYKTLNTISVSSTALVNNYHYYQSLNKHALIAPVLKSNAYGHGLTNVAAVVDDLIKPPFICVDSLYEAFELQKTHINTQIMIMGYTFPDNYKTIRKMPFTFPVYDLESLESLNKYQPKSKVHIKIDTGMNRLGIQLNDIPNFINNINKYQHINIDGIYSHLSQADDNTKSNFTHKQIEVFKEAIKIFNNAGIRFKWRHICASAGASCIDDPDFNLARVGLGFYGYSPVNKTHPQNRALTNNLTPALSLKSHLVQVKRVEKGSQISYAGTYTAKDTKVIGIIPMGYYDGIDRRLSNKGVVTIKGNKCPILGRVCMNLTVIDLTKVKNPRIGDHVTIIDANKSAVNSLTRISQECSTIPYANLVGLSDSTKRIIE